MDDIGMIKPYDLHVSGISDDTYKSDVRVHFSQFGPITRINVPLDPTFSKHKRFAFVSFEELDGLEKSLAAPSHKVCSIVYRRKI